MPLPREAGVTLPELASVSKNIKLICLSVLFICLCVCCFMRNVLFMLCPGPSVLKIA